MPDARSTTMRRVRLLLFAALAVVSLPAAAQTQRFYDAQGRVIGRAETSGSVTRFYDAQGRAAGQARGERRPSGASTLYDARGRMVGQVRGSSR